MIIRCAYKKIVLLKDLKPYPRNRTKHPKEQIEKLAKILLYQGIRWCIKTSNQSGLITSGHGRLEAAKLNGWTEFPVDNQDYDSPEQEYADVQADNAIASWAEFQTEEVQKDLLEMDFKDPDVLGIKDLKMIEPEKIAGCDEDEVPEVKELITKLGDLWLLGNHRLMCGDSTQIDCLDKLMNQSRAEITFTSPPYNVGRTPNGDAQKYLNDADSKEASEYCNFLFQFTTNALTVSDFVFCNIQSLSGNKVPLIDYLHVMKSNYSDTIIWDKMTAEPAMAKNVLNSRFEYVHVFSRRALRVIGSKEFRGTLDNVFQFNSRKDKDFSDIHKATFPVLFAEHFISNFSETSVYEPFGGSGSTLIACEKTNRKCFMMELDPHYCDVIITRWQNFTGKKAELINGQTEKSH